jgi:hypothetical protein
MSRNPKLAQLKDRLTPGALEKRASDLETRSIWRQRIAREHAITRGGVNTVAKGLDMVFTSGKMTRWMVYGVIGVQMAMLAVMVWWYAL